MIVRHALAFGRDRNQWRDDDARPLSPAGVKRARKAAIGLKTLARTPNRLLTSPLMRARQTAEILTDVAGWPRAEEVPELSPGTPLRQVMALLGKERGKRVAIVGHQPDLGALLAACLIADGRPLAVELKKSAVACLSFAGPPRPGRAVLKWLATPRMLRGTRS